VPAIVGQVQQRLQRSEARAGERFQVRLDRTGRFAAVLIALIVGSALLAPWLAERVLRTTPELMMRDQTGRFAVLRPPGPGYPLGTDDLGRDVLTRLLFAGRVSLTVGFLVAAIAVLIGTTAGLIAGYYGGWVDDLVNALVQLVFNVPSLFVMIALSLALRPDATALGLIFSAFFWPSTARQVRAITQSLRHRDYVEAARLLGASDRRIMLRHILPNVGSVVTVSTGFAVASAILSESALSYLGFGVQPPLASWGNMLSGSQDLFRRAPWLVYPPGLLIILTVLAVVLLADSVRDALDPRTSRQSSGVSRQQLLRPPATDT
jgi:peptide/nickel transport system permease protein